MTNLDTFRRRHDLSIRDIADILCVDPSTVRKYLAPPNARMHRSFKPPAETIIDYAIARRIPLDAAFLRKQVKYDCQDFNSGCDGRGDIEVAAAMKIDRTTVYRWRRDLDPPAAACKLIFLFNTYGWPNP